MAEKIGVERLDELVAEKNTIQGNIVCVAMLMVQDHRNGLNMDDYWIERLEKLVGRMEVVDDERRKLCKTILGIA